MALQRPARLLRFDKMIENKGLTRIRVGSNCRKMRVFRDHESETGRVPLAHLAASSCRTIPSPTKTYSHRMRGLQCLVRPDHETRRIRSTTLSACRSTHSRQGGNMSIEAPSTISNPKTSKQPHATVRRGGQIPFYPSRAVLLSASARSSATTRSAAACPLPDCAESQHGKSQSISVTSYQPAGCSVTSPLMVSSPLNVPRLTVPNRF